MQRVLLKYSEYLKKSVKFPDKSPSRSQATKVGRRTVAFEGSSVMSKRRKTAAIRKKFETNELVFATAMKLKEEGQKDAAKLLQEATQTSPKRAIKIRNSWRKTNEHPIHSYTDLEALALIVDSNLTTAQYKKIQKQAKKKTKRKPLSTV